jgi:hypothetical protein
MNSPALRHLGRVVLTPQQRDFHHIILLQLYFDDGLNTLINPVPKKVEAAQSCPRCAPHSPLKVSIAVTFVLLVLTLSEIYPAAVIY